ncbi:MAG: tetratricopeptide repeat protein [Phycisphaeraceae bacterium]|nr:tetratricopeptide repeat protein [Phycisphaeraceae bacterium]
MRSRSSERFTDSILRAASRPVLVAAVVVAASGLSCSTKTASPMVQESIELGPIDPADEGLPRSVQEMRRVIRATKPEVAHGRALPTPPGIDASRVTALTPDEVAANPNLRRPLDEVVPELASKVSLPKASDPVADEEAKAEAVRLYIAGRSALLAGDANQAQSLLTDAAGKDPAEAAVWRELAEAQYRLGRRTLAISSYTQAARRGLDEARVWWMLGKDSAQKSDLNRAAAYLARASQAPDLDSDAALPFLVMADLGETLAKLGYSTAAAEALRSAVALPETFTENTNYRSELGEVYRRRGELLEQAGDIAMQLGRSETAIESYSQAIEYPAVDPGATLVRFIYASALVGEPSKAAQLLIELVLNQNGWIEDRQLLLIRYLAENTNAGPALARALATMPEDLQKPLSPTLESRLVRAHAAADARGSQILRAYLAEHPLDAEVAADLIELTSRNGSAAGKEALSMAGDSPQSAVRLADALIRNGRALEASFSAIERGAKSPGQRALAAWLESRLGFAERAHATASEIDLSKAESPADRAVLLGVKLHCALDAGDFASASALVDQLKSGSDLPFAVRCGSLLDAGEDGFVIETAKALDVATLSDDTGERVAAAEILARAGRAKDAESILEAAIARDRFDERAYQSLIGLYLPNGPLKDEAKLGNISRKLRDVIPSSRAIRWLVAGELAQRQLWSQAESSLISIAEEGEPDPALIEQLVNAWERQTTGDADIKSAVLERADAWLTVKLKQYPGSVPLIAAKARILELQGKAPEAEKLLDQLLARYPIDSVARQREQLVRATLKDPARAKQLALARLDHAPRSADDSLELAEIFASADDSRGVTSAIIDGLPPGAILNTAQRLRLISLLNQQAGAAVTSESAESARSVLELIDRSVQLGVDLPRPLHESRLALLATYTPTDTGALVAAARDTVRAYPDGSTILLARTADRISKSSSPGAAPRFLREAIVFVPEPTTELYRYLAYYLTAKYGDINDVRALIPMLEDPARAVIVSEMAADGDQELPAGQAERVTLALHNVASWATLRDRSPFAMEIYRVVLGRDPRHAMSCNNLAYYMLEHGGDLAEAERLLTIAYAERPDTASVLDSLGWLRFKQGRLSDTKDQSGNVIEPGAVSLLTRALEARDGNDNAVITDHLGDALWAAGETQKAKDRWELARVSARRAIDQILAARVQRNLGEDDDSFKVELQELRSVLTQTEQKLKALADGKQPEIAAHATPAASHSEAPSNR